MPKSYLSAVCLAKFVQSVISVCLRELGLSPVEAVRNVIFLLRQSTPPPLSVLDFVFIFFTTVDEAYVVSEKLVRLSQGRFARHLLRGGGGYEMRSIKWHTNLIEPLNNVPSFCYFQTKKEPCCFKNTVQTMNYRAYLFATKCIDKAILQPCSNGWAL